MITRDWTVHPGETLRECLEERGMTETQLANDMGSSLKHVSQIVTGRIGITVRTAVKLDRALGVPAIFWLRLDAQHRLDVYLRDEGR